MCIRDRYSLNDRIVIGLLHNGKNCAKDEIDFVKSHQVTGRYCELRNNTPLENLDYLNSNTFKINFLYRELDQNSWQYCNKGFFNFKNYIPKIISTLN